ncbi:MAG: hypothetical protein V5A46_06140 [Haloferacaceae archaeon]
MSAATRPLAGAIGRAGPPVDATVAAATGGSATVVALVFLALFVATILSLYVAARLYQGYRSGGSPGMLRLGIGLVLLTTVPILLRLVFTNVPGADPTTRALLATASQLAGLLLILGVIYGAD